MSITDTLNPTEADRLAAFRQFLISVDDLSSFDGSTVDGNTITQTDGFSCWVVTRDEVNAAGLWDDNLETVEHGGTEWVVMAL